MWVELGIFVIKHDGNSELWLSSISKTNKRHENIYRISWLVDFLYLSIVALVFSFIQEKITHFYLFSIQKMLFDEWTRNFIWIFDIISIMEARNEQYSIVANQWISSTISKRLSIHSRSAKMQIGHFSRMYTGQFIYCSKKKEMNKQLVIVVN